TFTTMAPETDTIAALNYANMLLSNQSNVYLHWIDAGAPLQEIEVTTQIYSEKSAIVNDSFKLDTHNMDHHKEIQFFLNGLSDEAYEINLIWTWEIFYPTFGHTSSDIFTFPYPYIYLSA